MAQRIKQLEEERDNSASESNEDYERNKEIVAEEPDRIGTEKSCILNSVREENTQKQPAHAITGNDSGIEIDINNITREIKAQVEVMINEKLENFRSTHNREKDSTAPENVTKKSFIRTNCNQDVRDFNIIIHGINESETPDDLFIKELFGIMEVNSAPMLAHRLGEKKADRPRPIKIVMETIKHKTEFMSKLWKLRYAGSVHQKARITDDYTWEEREEIKRWVMMAKDKTEKDHEDGMTENVWKVRGTPKAGLRLVQIGKQ